MTFYGDKTRLRFLKVNQHFPLAYRVICFVIKQIVNCLITTRKKKKLNTMWWTLFALQLAGSEVFCFGRFTFFIWLLLKLYSMRFYKFTGLDFSWMHDPICLRFESYLDCVFHNVSFYYKLFFFQTDEQLDIVILYNSDISETVFSILECWCILLN